MVSRFQTNHTKRPFSTIFFSLLLACLLVRQVNGAVNWIPYTSIATGQIIAYSPPQLVNSNSAPVTFTQAFPLPASMAPVNIAFGISLFHVPNDQDFSIITNKTFSTSSFSLKVYLEDDTVCMQLRFNYIAMIDNSQTFRLLSDSINPTVISDSFGYRSETDIINVNTTGDPFFTSTSLSSAVVLEGIRIDPKGSFSFVDSVVTLGTNGTINATFFTFQEITITYISYSILFYNDKEASKTTQIIIQLGTVQFTSNITIATNFFNNLNSLSRYTTGVGSMFFGITSLNFTLSQAKKFGIDSSNYANLLSTYTFTSSIYSIKMSYFFVVKRDCGGQYFYYNTLNPLADDCVASCGGYPDRPINDNTYFQCLACDSSCATCNSIAVNTCLSCSANSNRALVGAAPTTCSCITNYVEVNSVCVLCSSQMVGCKDCSNPTTCSSCITGFTGPSCTCSSGSIITGFCNTVHGCTNISDINGTQTCINCNATLLMELTASFVCACINGTNTMADLSCQPKCGDNYVLKVENCDDGNLFNGDDCSSSCTIDQDWVCKGRYSQGSTCKINTTVTLTYMGVGRDTSSNTAIFYYSLSPKFSKYVEIDHTNLLSTSIDYQNLSVVYSESQNLLIATIQYKQDIQNTQQQFQLLLNNSKYFWYATNYVKPTLTGINCELTYDSNFEMRKGFYYTLMVLLFSSILVFIISCLFFEKWIGLQLIITYQTFYFQFALVKQFPFQLSPFPEVMKYSQGFDGILGSQYYRTYGLPNYLITLSVQKEFISNFNTMFLIIITIALVLIILGLRKRQLKSQLQQVISSDINKKLKKSEKWFSFMFSRIFMMSVFYSMFKIIFSFCIQLGNDQRAIQYFPDQLNVTAGITAFVIVFSMISYVLYWYLLLPDNFTEQQEFMSLQFQNMKFNYPIIYLAYQSLFILTLSILTVQSYIVYILLALQIIYLVILIFYRPYNTIHRLNSLIHNFTVIFNQLSAIFCLAIIMRWNSIIGSDYQSHSDNQLTAYSVLMLIMLMISLGLTIFRIAVFNKEISFKCCKKKEEEEAFEEIDYKSMKRMETDRREQFYKGEEKHIEMAVFSNLNGEAFPQQTQNNRKRKINNQPIQLLNEAQIDAYLNDKTIHWNKQMLIPNNAPKVSYKNIKKSSSSKKAELKKSSLELYLQSKKKKQQNDML